MEIWQSIIALVVGLLGGGGIVALIKAKSENKLLEAQACHEEANTDKVAAESWVLLIQNMNMRLTALAVENQELKQEVDDLSCEIDDLRGYMEKHGLTPPPRKLRKPKVTEV